MSFHAKKVNPEVKAQLEPLVTGVVKEVFDTVERIKKLDKSLKGYTDIGLLVYALERLEEDLQEEQLLKMTMAKMRLADLKEEQRK